MNDQPTDQTSRTETVGREIDDSFVVRFNGDVTAVTETAGAVTIEVRDWEPIRFKPADPSLVEPLLGLREGRTLSELISPPAEGGPRDTQRLIYYLSRFARGRLLEWAVPGSSGDRLVIESFVKGYAPRLDPPPAEPLSMSRFAYLRGDDGNVYVESASVPARARLGTGATDWLVPFVAGDPLDSKDPIAAALWRGGFLEPTDAAESPARKTWEFHDALFHVASRGLAETRPTGATYRFDRVFESPPAIKPAMSGERVPLEKPDTNAVLHRSRPLEQVMSQRSSRRDYAAIPIDIGALSELLYRVARTKEVIEADPQDLLARPYPAGGSIHELEFYLAVNRCRGLAEGMYHYDGHVHELVRLCGDDPPIRRMLSRSAAAMAQPDHPPDVLIVLSARVPRMGWKYQSMAYRAVVSHVGVVYQTLYLVATDMGLAACANGAGDHWAFLEATGLDPWEETAVGEFALGLPRDSS
jgi:SagB-type dehydrogenase family enzyme